MSPNITYILPKEFPGNGARRRNRDKAWQSPRVREAKLKDQEEQSNQNTEEREQRKPGDCRG